MVLRRRPRYQKKRQIRRRRMMKGRRKGNSLRYNGIKFFKETQAGVNIVMPAGGVNLRLKLSASLDDITDAAAWGGGVGTRQAFKALFGRYCITGVKYTFIPRFQSSDSTARAADRVIYAINRDPNAPVGNEETILRQNDAKFTNTNRKFTIYVKHPEPILYSTSGVDTQRTPNNMPYPAGGTALTAPPTNQVSVLAPKKQWTWLPTRYLYGEDGTSQQAVAHVGADVHITSCNNVPEEYTVYTMFKTVYYAFKEQD